MSEQVDQPFDGRRLFEIQIEQTIFVLAKDEADAEDIAKQEACAGGGIDWNDATFDIGEAGYVPATWAKSIPFGLHRGEKTVTCEQVMTATQEYEQSRQPTQAELEAMGQQRLV